MPDFRVGKPRIRLGYSSFIDKSDGTELVMPWDLVVFEDPVLFDPMTPTDFPINKTGLWAVSVGVIVYALAEDDFYVQVRDSTDASFQTDIRHAGTGGLAVMQSSSYFELAAGEVIHVVVGANAMQPYYVFGGPATYLAVTRVGPERWT